MKGFTSMKYIENKKNQLFICGVFLLLSTSLLIQFIATQGECISSYSNFSENTFFYYFFSGIKANIGVDINTFYCTPFLLLIFRIIVFFIPDSIISSPISNAKYVQQANFVCIFFICSCFLLWVSICLYKKRGYSLFLLLCSVLTVPFLYIIRNGGIELLPLILCTLFLQNYDSDTEWKKRFAGICLGLAGAMRIYPLLLGFLFTKKKYFFLSINVFFCATLISFPFVDCLFYFKQYVLLITESLLCIENLIVFLISMILLIKFRSGISLWKQYYTLFFLLALLTSSYCQEIYYYFILLLLFTEKYTTDKKIPFFLLLCECIVFMICSPFLQTFQTILCITGLLLIWISILITIIKEKYKNEILH